METRTESVSLCPVLPYRYGPLTAVLSVSDSMRGPEALDFREHLAAQLDQFLHTRGVASAVQSAPHGLELHIRSNVEPALDEKITALLQTWARANKCLLRSVTRNEPEGVKDDVGGFRFAQEREERFDTCLLQVAAIHPILSSRCAGDEWNQASGGNPAGVAALGEVFAQLRCVGHLSCFERQGLQLGCQGTLAPYGVPALMVQLTAPCKAVAERLGLWLLEGTPRIPVMWQAEPGILLFINTPPVDGILDESRFWQAFQGLPPQSWSSVRAWAAVRVLRWVKTPETECQYYDQGYLPRHSASLSNDGLPHFPPWPALDSPQLQAWYARRAGEIAVALESVSGSDHDLLRHVCGRLAIPYPFAEPLGPNQAAVCSVEEYLARCGVALHQALLDAESPDNPESHPRSLVADVLERLAGWPEPIQDVVQGNTSLPIGVYSSGSSTDRCYVGKESTHA